MGKDNYILTIFGFNTSQLYPRGYLFPLLDNYINYIILMDLTFGNQTWLGNPPSMEAFCGKISMVLRHVEKRGDKLRQL